MDYKIFFYFTLLFSNLAQADLYTELEQQKEIEKKLEIELKNQEDSSLKAYKEILEFVSSSNLNRNEQLKRLESANKAWDNFIKFTCNAKPLESIGTRAEYTNILQCKIKGHKEKRLYFNSLI